LRRWKELKLAFKRQVFGTAFTCGGGECRFANQIFLSIFPKANDSLHGLPAAGLQINLFRFFFDESVNTLGFLAQMLQLAHVLDPGFFGGLCLRGQLILDCFGHKPTGAES
jgi:hypothetical protein